MGLSSVDPGSTRPAVTQIEYEAGNPPLSPEAAALLKSMFSAYDRVTVAQELGGGLTQSRVFVLHPRHRDGSTDLPLVVKIGPDWLIQHEQQAYQQFIRDKLSGRIELVQAATAGNWGGLGYRLAGDGQFKHESLTQFCRRPDPEVISHVLNDRLFKRLHTLWRNARVLRQAYSAAKYDLLLPVHLIIEPQPLPPDAAVHRLSPENLSDNHLTPGDFVQLAGFIITEVNLETKTVTLDLPDQPDGPPRSHRLRLQPVERPEQYRVNQSMPPVSGVVVQTRPIQLQGEARKALSQAPGIEMTTETLTLPTGQRLPNPLPYTSTLLADWPPVKLAYLHGDLNLENILVDPQTRDVTLIDFANAGEDHILHDLLHLETNVVIHLLPEALNEVGEPPELIHSLFYERLHQAATADPTLWTAPDLLHPALKKIYLILAAIRQAAQPYLYDPHDWTEYQRGLALHLLGALKYKNLDTVPTAPLPKQLALLGAATAVDLWQNSVERTILATQIERQDRLVAHLKRDLAGAFDGKVAQESIALPNGANLLNPLPQLPQLLDPWLGDHLACIHGDLRLDNILVELETNGGQIPANVTHPDYVLHHLLRLETGVVAGLLPPALGQAGLPPETIHFLFYERLHRAALADPTQFAPPKLLPPSLEKPYTLLATLRRQAGQILPTDEAWQMYYRGLVLYLLGLIKLRHQDTMPETQSLKRVVFLVATVAFDLYRKPHQRPLLEPPYKGLQSFQEADAPLFFGRETFVEQLVTEVQQQPLVVVAGSSGSGKSSVVMAGLLPRLRQIGDWRVASFRPGSAPFEELVKALAPWLDLPDDEMVINRTVTALRQGATSLTDLLNPIYQRAHQSRLLLVADQFEELYTHCPDPATRHQFIDQLLAAVPPPSIGDEPTSKLESPLHLILTLRADFMGKVLTHRPFAEALQRAKVKLLGAMTRPELARVIEYPAETFGFSFEAGLVELILDDVGDEPGRLPLLEFALTLLWSLQDEGRLTAVAYDAIGRVKGAITYYAEHVYNDLNPDQQAEARRIFTQLVYPGVGTEDTRRIATKTELAADWP
ncbi:MAG: phosphotransferase, partial [Anaerolineae bacterium]|nr:phosphotransferase [Anaerolineae bacterium]